MRSQIVTNRHFHNAYKGVVSVLDAGAGQCRVTRALLSANYEVKGVELSKGSLDEFCQDLVERKIVFHTGLDALPFPNSSFDVVFSSEVLEHVPEDIVQASVNELSRVTKGPIFATISLRLSKLDPAPPKTPFVHITVKRRRWWDARFAMAGCVPDTKLLVKLQAYARDMPAEKRRNLMRGCVTKKPKGQECIKDGEIEPWFFPYNCNKYL